MSLVNPTKMSLVDQMVLAIGECELLLDLGTEELEDIARIGIAAIRVPTEDMLIAARNWSGMKYGKPIGDDDATGCWQVMIDAALRE